MKVGIVGSGLVGATAGYALVMEGVALSQEENAQLRKSAQVIRQALDELVITADERTFRGGRT